MNTKSPTLILFTVITTFFINGCQAPPPQTSTYNPKASAYNIQLGLGYLKQGNRQRAKQKLLTAVAEAPNSPYANEALAYYFENTHEVNQAENYYQKAITLAPKSGAILNNYATFLCRHKHYKEALYYFSKAAADSEYINTALAYKNAGFCAKAAHDTVLAKKYFKQALEQDPSLKQAREELNQLNNYHDARNSH